jgi:hypothetical protein
MDMLSTTHHVKDNPGPPMRVRWICNKARVSRHHANAIAALLFDGGRRHG